MRTLNIQTKDYSILLDDEDFDRISMFKWYCDIPNKYYYRCKCHGHRRKTFIPIANEVMQKFGVIFDHKDGDRKNNQKYNLREATHQQNCCNNAKMKYCSSKYKGVSWCKSRKKWSVNIQVNYKTCFLGYFNNEDDAALVYNNKATELHGEFARLNVIN